MFDVITNGKVNKLKPKEIDLSNYCGNESNTDTLNNRIMALVGTGGGTATVGGAISLWDDVSGVNPLVIKLNAFDSAYVYVYEPILVTHPTNGTVLQVCLSALMYHAQMGLLDIKVSINRDLATNGAVINVKVS